MDTPKFQVIENTPNFVYGKCSVEFTNELFESILKECDDKGTIQLEQAEYGNQQELDLVDPEVRSTDIAWINSQYANGKLDELVKYINEFFFNLDISDLPDAYQFTVYRNPNDHYCWHQDIYADDHHLLDFIRTLSVSVCLSPSDLYEGAEFFIKDGSENNVRVFKMKYGDFIVFPSLVEHRVNALRSGRRESLVAWYGYNNPNYKAPDESCVTPQL